MVLVLSVSATATLLVDPLVGVDNYAACEDRFGQSVDRCDGRGLKFALVDEGVTSREWFHRVPMLDDESVV